MPKAKKEKPEKKEKKVKDPNAPKKPAGAYIHFCSDVRAKVKEENPSFGATDIVKAMGAMWKEMSDADKKKYQDLAEKDKERYAKAMAAYKPE